VITARFNEKQKEAMRLLLDHNNEITELCFGGAAGGGKSYLGCAWIITMALTYPGTRYLIGRAVLKVLKETTLLTFFDVCKKWGLVEGEAWTFNTKDNVIKFTKKYGGSMILLKDLFLYPSDPEFDSLGSLEITGAVLDEVSQISQKAKDIVMSRIRYRLDDYNLIPKMLLVTNPAKNWSYTQFYLPWKEGRIASYRAFVQALPNDNKEYLSDHYVANLEKLPDASRERLLLGNWEYDDDQDILIPYDSLLGMFSNPVDGNRWYITADIARQGRDKTVIGLWRGFRLDKIVTIDKNNIPEAVQAIEKLRNQFGVPIVNIAIDEDGIGGAVIDSMAEGVIGIVGNSSPVRVEGQKENFGNLKSQLYFYLAKAINDGKLYVRCSPEDREKITRELEVQKRRDSDKDGKWWIIKKEQIKDLIGRSPDYADMMSFRMIFEIKDMSQWI
jgi:phage terminase large subunit